MDSFILYGILFIIVFIIVKLFKFVGINFLRFFLFILFYMIKFYNLLRIKKSEKRFL